MKIFLLPALFVVLFFACSNEGLDKLEKPVGNVFCLVQEQNKCYNVSSDVCVAISGNIVEGCALESSSSSVVIGGGESSSSSSDPEPGVSSSSDTGVAGESSSSGDLGGSSSSVAETGSSSSALPSSSSLAPPSLSECNLPSTYMHKGESILLADLPSLEGDNTGCIVSYGLQVGSSSSTSISSSASSISLSTYSGKTITITANAQCGVGTLPITKTCKSVVVADNYIKFEHNDEPKYNVSSGSTVIELTMDDLPTSLGCEFIIQGTNKVVFYVTTPSKRLSSDGAPNGKQAWWTALSEPFAAADYTSNGNRILFETQNEGIRCTTFR